MIKQLEINKMKNLKYKIMRKVAFILLMLLALSLYAQEDNGVIKFLGIPVDGSKSEMISKLKQKGFVYNSYFDHLTGKFNGYEVRIQVVDYNGKVGRILVEDAFVSNETDIIIRYNNLIEQFERTGRYIGENEKIDIKEDIHYEMSHNHKRYEAAYYQKSENDKDISEYKLNIPYNEVDEEYAESFHQGCVDLAKSYGDDYYEELYLKGLNEIQKKTKENIFEYDKMWLETSMIALQLTSQRKRLVWFMIDEPENSYRKYKILLFYDNVYNRGNNGQDL